MEWEILLENVGTKLFIPLLCIYLLKREFESSEKREAVYHDIIQKTQHIIEANQDVMVKLSEKYEDLNTTINIKFDKLDSKLDEIRKCGKGG